MRSLQVDEEIVTVGYPAVFTIALLGLALRLVPVGSSPFWNDEGITLWYVGTYTPVELAYRIPLQQPHLPLYYVLLDVWTAIVGFDEALVRFPSVVFGVATVLAIYVLGKRLFDERTALLVAFLVAISPFHVRISTYARMYSLLGLLAVVSFYAFVRLRDTGSRRWLLWHSASTLLLLLTHVYGIFVVLAQVGWVARNGIEGESAYLRSRRVLVCVGAIAQMLVVVGTLLAVKLLFVPLDLGERLGVHVSTVRQVIGPDGATVSPLQILTMTFETAAPRGGFVAYVGSGGRNLPLPLLDQLVAAGGTVLPHLLVGSLIGMWLFTGESDRPSFRMTAVWMGVPLVMASIAGLYGVQYRPRYAVVAALPFLLLVARSVVVVRRPWTRVALVLVISVLLVAQVGAVYGGQRSITDYEDAANFVDEEAEPGDVALVVYYRGASSFEKKPAGFYFRDVAIDIQGVETADDPGPAIRQGIAGKNGTVWLVSKAETNDVFHHADGTLSESGYRLVAIHRTGNVRVFEYSRSGRNATG